MMAYKSCINNFVYDGRSNRCDAYMAPEREIEKKENELTKNEKYWKMNYFLN